MSSKSFLVGAATAAYLCFSSASLAQEPDYHSPSQTTAKANALAAQGNVDGALHLLTDAMQRDDHPDYHLLRGQLFEKLGRSDAALADYQAVTKLGDTEGRQLSPLAWYYTGALHARQKAVEHSMAALTEAIKLEPRFAAAISIRGDLKRDADLWSEAAADYANAVALEPQSYRLNFNLGVAYFALNRFADAAIYLRRAIAIRSDGYAVLLNHLANLRAIKSDAKGTLASNGALLNKTEWPYPIVEVFLGSRTANSAIAKVKNGNERCEVYFYIGTWLKSLGRKIEGVRYLHAAVDTCPGNFIEGRVARAELKQAGN